MKTLLLSIAFLVLGLSSKAQTITTFPYFTGFEGVEGTLNENYPEGWTSEDFNQETTYNSTWEILKNAPLSENARTDSTAINLFGNMSEVNDDWIYTAGVQMVAGATYDLSFWYKCKRYGTSVEKLKIHIGTEATSSAMSLDPIWDNDNISNEEYIEATTSFIPETDGIYYFAFHSYSDPMQFLTLIDDVTINESNNTTNINNIEKYLSISPNPCSTEFMVSGLDFDGLKTIKLFNTSGQLILDKTFNNNNYLIQTEGIPAGVYHVIIDVSSKAIIKRKIVIVD